MSQAIRISTVMVIPSGKEWLKQEMRDLFVTDLISSGVQPLSKLGVSRYIIQWTLDYPDPRLSGSRTEIIARAYNDLRMRVEQLTKKLLYTEVCRLVGTNLRRKSGACAHFWWDFELKFSACANSRLPTNLQTSVRGC